MTSKERKAAAAVVDKFYKKHLREKAAAKANAELERLMASVNTATPTESE